MKTNFIGVEELPASSSTTRSRRRFNEAIAEPDSKSTGSWVGGMLACGNIWPRVHTCFRSSLKFFMIIVRDFGYHFHSADYDATDMIRCCLLSVDRAKER